MNDELLFAHHEASHAVIARNQGGIVGRIIIEGIKNEDGICSWNDGNVTTNTEGLNAVQRATVAVAGPIADIKYELAISQLQNGTELDRSAIESVRIDLNSAPEISRAISAVANQADSVEMHANVRASVGSKVVELPVFLGNPMSDAKVAMKDLEGDLTQLESVVANTTTLINTPQIEKQILDLTEQLRSRKTQNVVRKEMTDSAMQRFFNPGP